MRDSRVRVRIMPDVTSITRTIALHLQAMVDGMKRAFKMVVRILEDVARPPSPERLWIRERGRAELAEAELWFARHIATR